MLSLNKAAEAAGVSKSTIGRALKSGKLSGQRTDEGWSIDPAELFRVFPQEPSGKSHRTTPDPPAGQDVVELEVLRVKVAMLEDQLGRERETVDDLRARLDRAEERVLALTAQAGLGTGKPPEVPAHAHPVSGAPLRGAPARLWDWIKGRGSSGQPD